jgi:hypothetical protein
MSTLHQSYVEADEYLCDATFDTGVKCIAAEKCYEIDLVGVFLFVAV